MRRSFGPAFDHLVGEGEDLLCATYGATRVCSGEYPIGIDAAECVGIACGRVLTIQYGGCIKYFFADDFLVVGKLVEQMRNDMCPR